MPNLFLGMLWYAVFLFSTVVHEAAHAFAALRGGDPTAHLGGQTSLDPIPHIRREPLGTVVVPIASFLLGGWMIGWASTPYDPHWAIRNPRKEAWMALAGPASNLLLVLISGLAIKAGIALGVFYPPSFGRLPPPLAGTVLSHSPGPLSAAATILSIMFSLNLLLFVFNLLPIPPMDGSCAVGLLVGTDATRRYRELFVRQGLGLFGLFIAWNVFGYVFWPIYSIAIGLLYPGVGFN